MSIKPIELVISPHHFVVQSVKHKEQNQLVMERSTGNCYSTQRFCPSESAQEPINIYSLIGILPIKSHMFLAVVSEASLIGTIDSKQIYRIDETLLINFRKQPTDPEVEATKLYITALLRSGFYFSYTYDLTNTLEVSQKFTQGSLHERANTHYYWNHPLYKDFLSQSINVSWLIPIIHGYVGISEFLEGQLSMKIALISRRSRHKEGVLYRGIDQDGNSANFIESEQLLQVHSYIFSYVQVRGSVPIFWEQVGTSVSQSHSFEANLQGFKNHLNKTITNYDKIVCVNLLAESSDSEDQLSQYWESLVVPVKQIAPHAIDYIHFDFNVNYQGNLAKGNLISQLPEHSLDFFGGGLSQRVIIRTNCFDCLDRTSYVQSIFAWESTVLQMKHANFNNFNLSFEDSHSYNFGKAFKSLWMKNADILSLQSVGARSRVPLVPNVTIPLDSTDEFLSPDKRKFTVGVLLRHHNDKMLTDPVDREVEVLGHQEGNAVPVNVRVVTWNLAGKKLDQQVDYRPLFIGKNKPDLISISFQEIIKLNPQNVLREKNQKNLRILKFTIDNTLGDDYEMIACEDLVGCAIFIYARSNIHSAITFHTSDKVKVGFLGTLGNKGAVLVRFSIFDTNLCIYNCHLASGSKESEARKSQIREITKKGYMEPDIKILSGDLNFRVERDYDEAVCLLRCDRFESLIENDQLGGLLRMGYIKEYQEAPLTFPPTYKYNIGESQYATKKRRVPSWCDRILFYGKHIENLHYSSIQKYTNSDHKPVFAEFRIMAQKDSSSIRRQISEEVIRRYNPTNKKAETSSRKYGKLIEEESKDPPMVNLRTGFSTGISTLDTRHSSNRRETSHSPSRVQDHDILGMNGTPAEFKTGPPPKHPEHNLLDI